MDLVACLLIYMVFNAGGVQVIGWLMGSEMFPLAIRGKASSVHAATLWSSNLIITSTALSTVALLGTGGTMWVYAGLNFLCFMFVWHFVPETTGHSLEDIENHLRAGKVHGAKDEAGGHSIGMNLRSLMRMRLLTRVAVELDADEAVDAGSAPRAVAVEGADADHGAE